MVAVVDVVILGFGMENVRVSSLCLFVVIGCALVFHISNYENLLESIFSFVSL